MSTSPSSYFDTEPSPAWQDHDVLETLYWEQELSLREISSRLGCSKTTVKRWADHYGLQLRPPNNQKEHPSFWTNPEGYSYAESTINGDQAVVGIHELVAIANGADPAEVFRADTQIHHRLGVPGEFKAPHIDIPGNVTVMERSEHLRRHQTGTIEEPGIEDVLDGSTRA